MTFRLYLDEDCMDRDLVQALRTRGVDVLSAQELGMIEVSDEDHLSWATTQDRVLYSFNVGDFIICILSGSHRADLMLGLFLRGNKNTPSANRCADFSG